MRCGTAVPSVAQRCLKCGASVASPIAAEPVILARPAAPYASGDRIAGRYFVLEAYGAGPLGTTYRARSDDGRALAIKVVPEVLLPTSGERDAFVASFSQLVGRTMERTALPLDVGIDAGGVVFVVSPWVFGASLRRVLRAYHAAERRLSPDQSIGVLQGVAASLRELHTLSAHGALYPENIQITAEKIVLTDAVLAIALPAARLGAHLDGFPDVTTYVAPEVRAGRRANAGADLFGLGALASELLYGDPIATRRSGVVLPDTSTDLAESLKALVSAAPARRAAALPQCLDGVLRMAGGVSLPPYAVLPNPTKTSEARTRRIRSAAVSVPEAIGPTPRNGR